METIARLIDRDEKWLATIAISLLDAKAICLQRGFGLILIGAGIENDEVEQLRNYLTENALKIPIVKHYGGGSGLLFAEIYQGLEAF
ncbi:hypothetical protein FA048_00580 [Pedobacter polaris]|uniref:Uncharacterized protein n=2 Tax=Pedobacter polaris TaxID=2571273 RepID=A0A4U1CXJ3_9SPHI|nr:hypothetical protein FA048_00580 [Pedobacter polaris]